MRAASLPPISLLSAMAARRDTTSGTGRRKCDTGKSRARAIRVSSTASMRRSPFSSVEIMLRSRPTLPARACWERPAADRLSRTRSPMRAQLNSSVICAMTARSRKGVHRTRSKNSSGDGPAGCGTTAGLDREDAWGFGMPKSARPAAALRGAGKTGQALSGTERACSRNSAEAPPDRLHERLPVAPAWLPRLDSNQ